MVVAIFYSLSIIKGVLDASLEIEPTNRKGLFSSQTHGKDMGLKTSICVRQAQARPRATMLSGVAKWGPFLQTQVKTDLLT